MKLRIGALYAGQFYHVYNRGVDKRVIFHDDADNLYFLTLMVALNQADRVRDLKKLLTYLQVKALIDIPPSLLKEELVEIYAYSLVNNHFHLVLKELSRGGISKFMMKVSSAYSHYYNFKYQRVGRLFSGAFKYTHIKSDAALKNYIAYVSHNHEIHRTPRKYAFASSCEYDQKGFQVLFSKVDIMIESLFGNRKNFQKYSSEHVLRTLHERDHRF